MAKLTFKITNDDENNDKRNHNNQNNRQNPLSTKKNNEEQKFENNNQQLENNNEQKDNNNQLSSNSDSSSGNEKLIFIDSFCNSFGFNSFNDINSENIIQLLNQKLPKSETIVNLLNELINDDFIKKFKAINIQETGKSQTENEISLNQEKLLNQINELKAKVDILEEEKFRSEKKYSSTVSIDDMIREMVLTFLPNELKAQTEVFLKEAYINGDKDSKSFVISFLRGFQFLVDALNDIQEDEKQNLETLYKATTKLFRTIEGKIAAERRPLLDIVATLCNKYVTSYKFISPEQSLQIDTQIHNAQGKGGTMIKEGLSMVVVRTDTGKTVYYADINTK